MKKYSILLFIILPIIGFAQVTTFPPSENNPEPPIDLSNFIDTTSFFPGRAAIGIELSPTYELDGKWRMEYGLNFIYTSWVNLNKNYNKKNGELANKNWGLHQFGPTASFAKVANPNGGNDLWTARLGILYNRINVPFYSLGVTAKVKAVAFIPQKTDNPEEPTFFDFENLYLQPEIGITWMSVFNIYYSRNVGLNNNIGAIVPNHSIKFTLNINASFFKFGLQGM